MKIVSHSFVLMLLQLAMHNGSWEMITAGIFASVGSTMNGRKNVFFRMATGMFAR